MSTFKYYRPKRFEELWQLMTEYNNSFSLLAGGTDLLVRLRKGRANSRAVIDIKELKELRGDVQEIQGGLRIGALALLGDLVENGRMKQHFTALVEAMRWVGSTQIRNRATLTGNICNASPAADTAPALLVYGARVNILGQAGERSVALEDFFLAPGRSALKPHEIAQSIDLPYPATPNGASFLRLTRRRGFDLATVSVACLLTPESGQARFGLGAVAPTPRLAIDTSGVLSQTLSVPSEKESALEKLAEQATPISDVRASKEYRQAMLLALLHKSLHIATERLNHSRS